MMQKFSLTGNPDDECSSLKQWLCSPQNQLNFTFQEWSSVPAAELGGWEEGVFKGYKEARSSVFVSCESAWEASKKELLLLDTRNCGAYPTLVTTTIINI